MRFEWDEEKERKNIAKHGILFKTAVHVFEDGNRLEFYDEAHSLNEDRYITIGEANRALMVLQVVYTERSEVIRIISARRATKSERKAYYDCKNNA